MDDLNGFSNLQGDLIVLHCFIGFSGFVQLSWWI